MRSHGYASVIAVLVLVSSGVFAAAAKPVVIATPVGGEVFIIGSQQRVRLDLKTRSKSVQVELSRDGGTTFAPLGTIDNTVKDKTLRNVLVFTVTAPASSACVIRASADGASSLSSGFSIGTSATGGPVTANQISSGTAATGAVLSSDGNGGTAFNPLTVNSGQISSGAASTGTVLVSNGSGGTAFQSLDGTFVRVAGDNMTGALNVAGNVGVGTTTPRATLEVANPTSTNLALSAGAGMFTQWRASSTGLFHEAIDGNSASTLSSFNFGTRDFRYGTSAGGAVTARGNGSVTIDGAFSFEAANLTSSFTANDATCGFFCNTTSGNITVTLPTAVGRSGRVYFIKKTVAANTMTIDASGAETIDGVGSIAVAPINSVRMVMSNGTNWFVISSQ